MPTPPRVSVILIVHNGAKTLRMALSSLLIQTFQNWECIIVNDASTDSTYDILTNLTDPRFRSFHSSQRLGRGSARQIAFQSASAPYVCTLDADDFFYPDKLKNQVAILDSNLDLTATVGGMFYFNEKLAPLGVPVGYFPPGTRRVPRHPSHLRIPFGPTMFRRDEQDSLAYAAMPRSEDRRFYTDLLSGQEINVEREPSYACFWRMSPADIQLGLDQNLKIYRAARDRSYFWGTSLILYTYIKRWVYLLIQRCGMWHQLTHLKYRQATPEQNQDFQHLVRALLVMTSKNQENSG